MKVEGRDRKSSEKQLVNEVMDKNPIIIAANVTCLNPS